MSRSRRLLQYETGDGPVQSDKNGASAARFDEIRYASALDTCSDVLPVPRSLPNSPDADRPVSAANLSGGVSMTPDDFFALAKKHEAEMVDLKFVDMLGSWQHCSFPLEHLDKNTFT